MQTLTAQAGLHKIRTTPLIAWNSVHYHDRISKLSAASLPRCMFTPSGESQQQQLRLFQDKISKLVRDHMDAHTISPGVLFEAALRMEQAVKIANDLGQEEFAKSCKEIMRGWFWYSAPDWPTPINGC